MIIKPVPNPPKLSFNEYEMMINEYKTPPKRLKSYLSMILNYHFAPDFLRFSYTYTIQNYTLHGLSTLFIILIIKYLYRFPEVSKTISVFLSQCLPFARSWENGKHPHRLQQQAPPIITRRGYSFGAYSCLYLLYLFFFAYNFP